MARKGWHSQYEYTPRGLRQQAKLTVGDNPIFALVELITNANEAYRKLEEAGIKHKGEILIEVTPKRKGSVFAVTDYATGMDEKDFEAKVKKIGGDTSGLTKESGGRSYWGRGLKEVMIAFGFGEITSIKNGELCRAFSRGTEFEFWGSRRAMDDDYKIAGAVPSKENYTRVLIKAIDPELQRTPQIETLAEMLSHYFELRDLLNNPHRKVILRYLRNGHLLKEIVVTREYIPAKLIFNEPLKLAEFPEADVLLEVLHADEELPNTHEKYLSERGYLVASRNAIWAISSFGFENHPAASHLFGRVTSKYIDYLLREKDIPLFDPSRTGNMNMKQDFCRALNKAVVETLRPIYERELAGEKISNEIQDKDLDQRVRKALAFLNREVKKLLEEEADTETTKDRREVPTKHKEDLPPPDGFNFMPPFVQIPADTPSTLTLKLAKDLEHLRKTAQFVSSNRSIQLIRTEKYDWVFNQKGFWVLRLRVVSPTLGEVGKITATIRGFSTSATVETVDKSKSKGFFGDWAIERGVPPEQRAIFIRSLGKIVISADAPSVHRFVWPPHKQKTIEARLLIAELVLQTGCQEIARQMILRGKEPLLTSDPNSIAEQIQSLHTRLINKFAEPVQRLIL